MLLIAKNYLGYKKMFEGFYSIFVIIRRFLLFNKGRWMDKALIITNTYWRKSRPKSAVPVGGISGPVLCPKTDQLHRMMWNIFSPFFIFFLHDWKIGGVNFSFSLHLTCAGSKRLLWEIRKFWKVYWDEADTPKTSSRDPRQLAPIWMLQLSDAADTLSLSKGLSHEFSCVFFACMNRPSPGQMKYFSDRFSFVL